MNAAKLAVEIVTAENDNHIGKVFKGRTAWALRLLCNSGADGVSRLEHASTSLPFYVFKLRQELGDDAVKTVHEKHGGPFAGTHARYILADQTIEVGRIEQSVKAKPVTVEAAQALNSNPIGKNGGLLNG